MNAIKTLQYIVLYRIYNQNKYILYKIGIYLHNPFWMKKCFSKAKINNFA